VPTIGLSLIIGLFPLQLLPSLDPLAPLLRLGFQLLSLRCPDLQPNVSLLLAIGTGAAGMTCAVCQLVVLKGSATIDCAAASRQANFSSKVTTCMYPRVTGCLQGYRQCSPAYATMHTQQQAYLVIPLCHSCSRLRLFPPPLLVLVAAPRAPAVPVLVSVLVPVRAVVATPLLPLPVTAPVSMPLSLPLALLLPVAVGLPVAIAIAISVGRRRSVVAAPLAVAILLRLPRTLLRALAPRPPVVAWPRGLCGGRPLVVAAPPAVPVAIVPAILFLLRPAQGRFAGWSAMSSST